MSVPDTSAPDLTDPNALDQTTTSNGLSTNLNTQVRDALKAKESELWGKFTASITDGLNTANLNDVIARVDLKQAELNTLISQNGTLVIQSSAETYDVSQNKLHEVEQNLLGFVSSSISNATNLTDLSTLNPDNFSNKLNYASAAEINNLKVAYQAKQTQLTPPPPTTP